MTRLGAEQEPRCESGWTGDRCDLPIFHEGPHSNEQVEERPRLSVMARRVGVNKRAGRRLVWEF